MAGKLGYKFVNPALTSDEKTAVKSAGIPADNLPHKRLLLGVNRLGAATNSIYDSVKALKGLEEVRAISLRDEEVDKRRARRDKKLDVAEDRQEGKLTKKDMQGGEKEAANKIKKDKKSKGILEKIFGPIFNVLAPFIKFAALYSTLKWFSDPKNLEKVERFVEFLGQIFKFLYKWAEFGVTNVLNGLGNVFGGVGKFKEGNILGGAWDSVMGLGQLLMGLIALKGLALFLNPFKLMGRILDLMDVADAQERRGGGSPTDCLPDIDPTDGRKGRKPKGRFAKLLQRARIGIKRLRRFLKPILLRALSILSGLTASLATRIAKFGASFMKRVAQPLIRQASEEIAKRLPAGAIEGAGALIKSGQGLVKGVTEGLAQKGKDLAGFASKKGSEFAGFASKKGSELLGFASKQGSRFKNWASSTYQSGVKAKDALLKAAAEKWATMKQGAIDMAQKAVATAKGWGDNIIKGVVDLKNKAAQQVVDGILAPLKAQADNLIAKSPVLQKVLGIFGGGAGKEGLGEAAEAAFKKFLNFAKPTIEPLAKTLKGLNLPVIDTVVEGLFALYNLKQGVPPVRVAMRLGGSIAGLALGTALTGSAAFFSGGMGAFLAPVLIGVTQFGGEWLADRLADMMGIPEGPEGSFAKGGIITDRSFIEVAEEGPEVVADIGFIKQLINPMTNMLPGASLLVGSMASLIDTMGNVPGVSAVKGELNSIASALGADGFALPRADSVKMPSIQDVDTKGGDEKQTNPFAALLSSLSSLFGGNKEEEEPEEKKKKKKSSGGGGGGGGDSSSSNITLTNTDYLKLMVETMNKGGISDKNERIMFMAQVGHESGEGRYMEEIASGAAYEGRSDLGNNQPGDGKRFKGRGYIQITGRANYRRYGPMIGVPDAVENPTKLAEPQNAAKVALAYWKDRVNRAAAKRGLNGMNTVTRNINGGLNGLQDRIAKFKKYSNVSAIQPGAEPEEGNEKEQNASLGGVVIPRFAGGGGVRNTPVVMPIAMPMPMMPGFSSGGAIDSMSIEQLKKMLDPTMPGARNPAVFQAASNARRQYRTLGREERERRVLVATVKAMRQVSGTSQPTAAPRPAPRLSVSAPAPQSSGVKQSSAMVTSNQEVESDSPTVVPIPSVLPVPINNGGPAAPPTPVYVKVGLTSQQRRFSKY